MTFAVTFRDKQVGRKYSTRMAEHSRRHRAALISASGAAKDDMLKQGRDDIARAGNFGSRWTDGLRGEVTARGGDINIAITHDVPYFMVHQQGAVIRGKPLLWIPLSFAKDAQGVLARDFPGPLFRVDRKSGSKPLLLSGVDKQPKYFGAESVRIPKRFHVIEIIRDVARTIPRLFEIAVKGHF